MTTRPQQDWSPYYDATRAGDHFRLLDDAVAHHEGESYVALDVGAGALRNTCYLVARSYQVDALDNSPLLVDEVERLNTAAVHPYCQAFDDFTYITERYGIAVASNALTFNPPQTFWRVIQDIKASLAPGGVLCANFSGMNDQWAGDSQKSFVTRDELLTAFDGLQIILCDEWERETVMALGGKRHTHAIDLIAQRPV